MCKQQERKLKIIYLDQIKTRAPDSIDEALMDLLDDLREAQDEAYSCHPKRARELGDIMRGVRYARTIINNNR